MAATGKVAGVPGGVAQMDALQVSANGTNIWGIQTGTFVLNILAIPASSSVEQLVTVTGVRVGDIVVVAGPDAGLDVACAITAAYVSANDTVKFRVVNASVGALDPASATFRYLWIDVTE